MSHKSMLERTILSPGEKVILRAAFLLCALNIALNDPLPCCQKSNPVQCALFYSSMIIYREFIGAVTCKKHHSTVN